jgi:acetyltransferase-like isoleucine patch superfamily enzyme
MLIKRIIKKAFESFGYRLVAKEYPEKLENIVINKGQNNDLHIPPDKNILCEIDGNGNIINIDDSLRVDVGKKLQITVNGNGHRLSIGKNVRVRRGLHIKLMLAGSSSVGCHNCAIEIDDSVFFGGRDIQLYAGESNTKITIGKDTMLADNVIISTSDCHAILDATTGERINPAADISIGNHVWIGMNTILFKGSAIPNGSVLAANAVVTRCFTEENVIVAGIPASIVKRGVTWRVRLS